MMALHAVIVLFISIALSKSSLMFKIVAHLLLHQTFLIIKILESNL